MPSRDCDRCINLQTTIDRISLELAQLQAEHRRTTEERDQAQRRASRWERVAQMLHAANQNPTENP